MSKYSKPVNPTNLSSLPKISTKVGSEADLQPSRTQETLNISHLRDEESLVGTDV